MLREKVHQLHQLPWWGSLQVPCFIIHYKPRDLWLCWYISSVIPLLNLDMPGAFCRSGNTELSIASVVRRSKTALCSTSLHQFSFRTRRQLCEQHAYLAIRPQASMWRAQHLGSTRGSMCICRMSENDCLTQEHGNCSLNCFPLRKWKWHS